MRLGFEAISASSHCTRRRSQLPSLINLQADIEGHVVQQMPERFEPVTFGNSCEWQFRHANMDLRIVGAIIHPFAQQDDFRFTRIVRRSTALFSSCVF
jgi:hypothetical protein